MPYDDDSTAARFLDGDPEAIGIVSRWIAVVLSSPRFRSLRHRSLDLHQEAVLRVLEALRRELYEPTRDLRVYVQAIARHAALRAQFASEREKGSALDPAQLPDGREWDVERRVLVDEILAGIEEECRNLILAYFLEEQSYDEIAADLGLPVGTIKSRLFRCLAAFRRALKRRRRPVAPPGIGIRDRFREPNPEGG